MIKEYCIGVGLRKTRAVIFFFFSWKWKPLFGALLVRWFIYAHFLSWLHRRVEENVDFPCFALSLFLWTVHKCEWRVNSVCRAGEPEQDACFAGRKEDDIRSISGMLFDSLMCFFNCFFWRQLKGEINKTCTHSRWAGWLWWGQELSCHFGSKLLQSKSSWLTKTMGTQSTQKWVTLPVWIWVVFNLCLLLKVFCW